MTILERQIQVVRPGKWEELHKVDKEWTAIERRYGCPSKTRYTYISGRYEAGTLVVERRWESIDAHQAAFKAINADPEAQAVGKHTSALIESSELEFLWVVEE